VTDPRSIYRHGQAVHIVIQAEKAIDAISSSFSLIESLPKEQLDDIRRLHRKIEDVMDDQLRPLLDTLKKHIRSILPDEPPPL
jgi:hypothetical protein